MNLAFNNENVSSWQQALVESIEVGIVVVNNNFEIEEWNQFMVNHTNHETNDVRGNSLFQYFSEIDRKWLENKCRPAFEMQTPVFMVWEQRQYLFKMPVARPITSPCEFMYQNITIFPVTGNQGKVERICFLIYDVTDQAMAKTRIEGLNERLKEISRIDGLTNLYNRRYWQERFEREYKLCMRHQTHLSVLIMDIDHFKSVNDTYGHQAGDSVIQKLADVIRVATRETDIIGRYGGEEFVVLLPDTDSKNATIVAQRIRKLAEKTTVKHDDKSINFTVSVGIAQMHPKYTQPLQWLEAADNALYDAKKCWEK